MTQCWSAGKAGQLYINLVGREAEGAVDPGNYDRLLTELSDKLGRLTAADGTDLAARVTRKDDIHFGPLAERGPDLFVSFDDYGWQTDDCAGYGKGQVFRLPEAEEQPAAAHGLRGYLALAGPDVPSKGELPDISLLSIAPTIFDILGLKAPPDMERPSILALLRENKTPSPPGSEQQVRSRLEALGY